MFHITGGPPEGFVRPELSESSSSEEKLTDPELPELASPEEKR